MTITAIVSGGMDSVTLAHKLVDEYPGDRLHIISFDYGQRHAREIGYARECASKLGAEIEEIRVPRLGGSALTDSLREIPEGHYAADNMADTVVPNRNMVMLSVAISRAVESNSWAVATGIHAGDHAVYPDCRPDFVRAMTHAARVACEGFIDSNFEILAPFIDKTKADIVVEGHRLGVAFDRTWSCYKGGAVHCGRCGTCEERAEAFALAGVDDPTVYAQPPTLRDLV